MNEQEREEMRERQIDFIINQQAQLTVDIQKLQEQQGKTESVVLRLANIVVEIGQKQKELAEAQDKTQQQLDSLVVAQRETGEKLDAVILMAERFFSSRNGSSQ